MKFAGSIETQLAKAESPSFCNWLIAVESPRTSKFPSLSSKPGPDGGINGQWDLSGAASPIDSPFTRKGWNVSFEPESPQHARASHGSGSSLFSSARDA
jgi:hypothetical protein